MIHIEHRITIDNKDNYMDWNNFKVSDQTQKSRIDICNLCERYNTTLFICKECGCLMPAKTLFKSQRCPLGKWESVKDSNEQV